MREIFLHCFQQVLISKKWLLSGWDEVVHFYGAIGFVIPIGFKPWVVFFHAQFEASLEEHFNTSQS